MYSMEYRLNRIYKSLYFVFIDVLHNVSTSLQCQKSHWFDCFSWLVGSDHASQTNLALFLSLSVGRGHRGQVPSLSPRYSLMTHTNLHIRTKRTLLCPWTNKNVWKGSEKCPPVYWSVVKFNIIGYCDSTLYSLKSVRFFKGQSPVPWSPECSLDGDSGS